MCFVVLYERENCTNNELRYLQYLLRSSLERKLPSKIVDYNMRLVIWQ